MVANSEHCSRGAACRHPEKWAAGRSRYAEIDVVMLGPTTLAVEAGYYGVALLFYQIDRCLDVTCDHYELHWPSEKNHVQTPYEISL